MRKNKIIVIVLIVLSAIIIVRNAWLCDDAYITFRVVDNFINGYGLRWNVAERVQVYTHPLWMFLLSFFYFFTREIFFTSNAISIILSILAITLAAFKISKSHKNALLALTILCLSKAFIDYSASGLENPLTHLILILFFITLFNPDTSRRKLLALSFFTSLGVLNRMDTLLLFAPSLCYAVFEHLRTSSDEKLKSKLIKTFGFLLIGFLPFILWEAFSVFYYGFPFPNTAYAKLNTGIPAIKLAKQGLYYLISSFPKKTDLVTPLVVLSGIMLAVFSKSNRNKFIAAGIFLYILYIIKIGGGFMMNRFLAAPLLCSVVIICRTEIFYKYKILIPTLASVIILGFLSPFNPVLSGINYENTNENVFVFNKGISDERGFYYKHSSLLKALKGEKMPSHQWVDQGIELREKKPFSLIYYTSVGYLGFFAGPHTSIIDAVALCDPLLARLPVPKKKYWRIGHFERIIPYGYTGSMHLAQSQFKDKGLEKYYYKLSQIISGDLFDKNRFVEIWKMNTGQYKHLLENYKRDISDKN
ncbi:MAG: hypothetical protein KKD07_03840 [Candidatus Omnitrophica bacterium]|nr:hypothetical protein [Candidatus Omnitrophota bacterium]MBU1996203.1 hypothetical protein [Candidatus Omnitrophota bacterium]MBU4333556.1 hypothetical protein [Candidatus Omnitrophota bacterium]